MPALDDQNPRRSHYRQKALMALIAAIAAGVLASSASAGNGANWYQPSGLNATRVNIYRYALSWPANGIWAGILNVRAQGCGNCSGDTGLFQEGYYRNGGLISTSCGNTQTNVLTFIEYHISGSGYHCIPYDNASINNRFGVVQLKSFGSGYWGAYIDGIPQGPAEYVGFSTGSASAGGEYQGNYGTIDACFGCSGLLHWQWSSNNGSSYSDIGTRSGTYNDTGWYIEPSPSPFRIHTP